MGKIINHSALFERKAKIHKRALSLTPLNEKGQPCEQTYKKLYSSLYERDVRQSEMVFDGLIS